MADTSAKHQVAIIGCGRLGQKYADAYSTYPDTEIVAIAEYNDERRQAVGERFGIMALYPDVHALLADVVPDIAAIVREGLRLRSRTRVPHPHCESHARTP